MPQDYNATIIKKERLSEHLIILQVKPDFPVTDFKAGQFAVLGLKMKEPRHPQAKPDTEPFDPEKMIKKAYSIASAPEQKDFLEFYIIMVPEGSLTPRLVHLKEGDRLFVGPKITGKFILDNAPPHKHILMIATGTGLAPYMSMIRSKLVCGGSQKFIIVHGARHSYELGYYQELMLLDQHCPNFTYIPAVSRPAEEKNHWPSHSGRLTQLIPQGIVEKETRLKLIPENFDVFLCGNPDMIRDMTDYLKTLGFKPDEGRERGDVHMEEYW